MAEERKRIGGKHTVSMEQREQITMTGVIDVLSFDEESILVDTDLGLLILRGNNLHVGRLNLDDGEVFVDGLIDSLEYSDGGQFSKGKGSFFGRVFK